MGQQQNNFLKVHHKVNQDSFNLTAAQLRPGYENTKLKKVDHSQCPVPPGRTHCECFQNATAAGVPVRSAAMSDIHGVLGSTAEERAHNKFSGVTFCNASLRLPDTGSEYINIHTKLALIFHLPLFHYNLPPSTSDPNARLPDDAVVYVYSKCRIIGEFYNVGDMVEITGIQNSTGDGFVPWYGVVLGIVQYVANNEIGRKHGPLVFIIHWFMPFNLDREYNSRPVSDKTTMGKNLSQLPLTVFQPFFKQSLKNWESIDVVQTNRIRRKVYIHPIPSLFIPHHTSRHPKVQIYFLNTIASFPIAEYAQLILADPVVLATMRTDYSQVPPATGLNEKRVGILYADREAQWTD